MPFVKAEELPRMELFPGARSGLVAGRQLMLSFLVMETGARVPEHSHPHEQAGLMIEGVLRFRIGGEEQVLVPGDAFLVPPDMAHSGEVLEGPAKVLDIFSPPREDYIENYNRYTQTSGQTRWS
ncbi:MAG: cupin domain-containing protein [Candidatus Handelsmanbacteria bacterium]|nr:cupin domain-containing protein [Candidatus Handelsmanbacteria bacterium]